MYIEVDGKEYFIHLNSNSKLIRIKKVEDDTVHLEVPVSWSEKSLLSYIRTFLNKEIPQPIVKHTEQTLQLFDKTYPVKFIISESPYMENNTIYTNFKNFSNKSLIEKLKTSLLKNLINNKISIIEEDLNILLPDVHIRKLKTNYYTICPSTNRVTFNKKLIDKSISFIRYIVILMSSKYLNLSQEESQNLLNKHISDWKHCERILKYEQQ